MSRPVTPKVQSIRSALEERIRQGHYLPGEQIPSARAIARQHQVSYQTAHRILSGLAEAGLVETRHGSGTRVVGRVSRPSGVLLRFHPRARRKGSFGAHLKQLLETALQRESIGFRTAWTDAAAARYRNLLPVYWEPVADAQSATGVGGQGYALLLNDRRVSGLQASRVDTIATDDFSGGACAAELLRHHWPNLSPDSVGIVAARTDDPRSVERVAGFRSVLPVPDSHLWQAGSWDRTAAEALAEAVERLHPQAVFCCNDRLAQGLRTGLLRRGEFLPALVGFDNAPVAETLGLTTVGVPWEDFIAAAVEVLQRRLSGDRGVARRQIFAPQPVVRAWGARPV